MGTYLSYNAWGNAWYFTRSRQEEVALTTCYDVLAAYLLIRLNGEFIRGTANDGVVVVGVPPPAVPGEGEGGADAGETEDLTLVVLGGRVDEELQGALEVELGCGWEERVRNQREWEKEIGRRGYFIYNHLHFAFYTTGDGLR